MPARALLLADAEEVHSHLDILTAGRKERGVEIRAMGGLLPVREAGGSARKRGAEVGFFVDLGKAAQAALHASSEGFGGVYVTLNEIRPEVLSRGDGQMVRGGEGTQDKDVARFRHLLFDFDPLRPSGISSTEGELELAEDLALKVQKELDALGWGPPLYRARSGNGAHLVYRINLTADDKGKRVVRAVLRAAADFWSDANVAIDASVGNPSRIVRVIGTVARKGANGEDRPWRLAKFLEVNQEARTVTASQMNALASEHAEAQGKKAHDRSKRIRAWKAGEAGGQEAVDALWQGMEAAGLEPGEPRARDYGLTVGSRCWERDEDNEDGNRPGWVVVTDDGQLRAGCRHATCKARVETLLRATGLGGGAATGEAGANPFATSPDDDTAAAVNALGISVLFSASGVLYLVTHEKNRHTLRLKNEAVREYVASRVPFVEGQTGAIHPLTVWSRSPQRREAHDLVYDPSRAYGTIEAGRLNLWRGFAYDPRQSRRGETLFRAWREHLLRHICAGREEPADYLWKLMAWKVQNPTVLPMVLVVTMGKPGAGKTIAFRPLVNLFGEHGLHTESPLLGARFNDALEGKAVVFHDEADHLGDPRVMRTMKARVTESTGTYEAKGHSLYQAPSFPLHICATNARHIRIDPGDRRCLVLEARVPSSGIHWFEHRNLREIVNAEHLVTSESKHFHSQLLWEALTMDLTGFRPNPPPWTEERDRQIVESAEISPLQAWVQHVLDHGKLPSVTGPAGLAWGREEIRLGTEDRKALHLAYLAHCEKSYGKTQWERGLPGRTLAGFAKGLLHLTGGRPQLQRVRGKRGPAERVWVLPALEHARRQLRIELGVDEEDGG